MIKEGKMFNQIQIIGNVGKDPEIRAMPSGDLVANFSVATSEKWKDKAGELQTKTEWHNVTVYGKLAEICEKYLKSGKMVFIQGSVVSQKYTDKNGIEKRSTHIKADTIRLLGGEKTDTNKSTQNNSKPPSTGSGFDDMDDSIPF
jgi:single-strand DNA-binding protein